MFSLFVPRAYLVLQAGLNVPKQRGCLCSLHEHPAASVADHSDRLRIASKRSCHGVPELPTHKRDEHAHIGVQNLVQLMKQDPPAGAERTRGTERFTFAGAGITGVTSS